MKKLEAIGHHELGQITGGGKVGAAWKTIKSGYNAVKGALSPKGKLDSAEATAKYAKEISTIGGAPAAAGYAGKKAYDALSGGDQ